MPSLNELADDAFQLECDSKHYSLERLRREGVQQRNKYKHLNGKSVAIQGNTEHILRWMFYLDGFVEYLVLVPSESCARAINSILEGIEIDEAIVDESVDKTAWPDFITMTLSKAVTDVVSVPFQCNINTQWMISTSGTTGASKLVKHNLKSLCRTVARKEKHSLQTWGLLYDPTRFAGLQVVLQAMISGATLVVPDRKDPLSQRIEYMIGQGVSAISATPTLWRRLLMIERLTSLGLRQLTIGGEIADARLINTLTTMFPDAHISHIFASTEAGVGFAVHDGKEGFPLAWIDKNNGGVKLSISDSNTLLIQSLEKEQTYANTSAIIFDEQGWHDTGDMVEISGDRVVFKGRLNGSINVGGNKVMPEEVESHIEKLDFVCKSVVQARRSSIVGNLLEVSLVLASNEINVDDAVKKVRAHCSGNLAAYKVPAFVKVVDEIPMTASGKVKRGK